MTGYRFFSRRPVGRISHLGVAVDSSSTAIGSGCGVAHWIPLRVPGFQQHWESGVPEGGSDRFRVEVPVSLISRAASNSRGCVPFLFPRAVAVFLPLVPRSGRVRHVPAPNSPGAGIPPVANLEMCVASATRRKRERPVRTGRREETSGCRATAEVCARRGGGRCRPGDRSRTGDGPRPRGPLWPPARRSAPSAPGNFSRGFCSRSPRVRQNQPRGSRRCAHVRETSCIFRREAVWASAPASRDPRGESSLMGCNGLADGSRHSFTASWLLVGQSRREADWRLLRDKVVSLVDRMCT